MKKRKRKYRVPPIEVEGLTKEQVNLLRKQQNPQVLITVYKAVVKRLNTGKSISPHSIYNDTGYKREQIRRAMRKIETLLYGEAA